MKAIIFDLDGTLLDTLHDLADAMNQALARLNMKSLPIGDYRMMVGAGARNLAIRAAVNAAGTARGNIPDTLIDQLLQQFNDAYAKCWANQTTAYPGIFELLAELKTAGYKLAILSNKPDAFTQLIVDRFFPADCFWVAAGKKEGWPIKPDPALALELCRQMAVEPGETALVGDSGSDMETAKRAGILPIGVLWGFRSAAELSAAGAAFLADNPAMLGEYLIQRR